MTTVLERFFSLRANGTTVRTEVLAGFTTFVTMAYILFVNPNILKDAGMPVQAAFAATCVASAFATLIMGLYANYPIAVAPGMGLNAYFTYTLCVGVGLSWQTPLGAVFISGLVFLLLTATRVREWLVRGVPMVLRTAISVGIGLFIAFIGFKNAGIVVANKDTFVALGDVKQAGVLVAIGGLAFTVLLVSRRVRGALLIGIVGTTALAMASGIAPVPHSLGALVTLRNPFADLAQVAFHLDIMAALKFGFFSILFTLTFVDLFDTLGTLIGVARKAGLTDDEENLPRIGRALLADSLGTIFGALMGTSTVTSYVESTAGVSEGGRTGLSSVVVSGLFMLALFFSPLVGVIPPQATAPALIVVGVLMMEDVTRIDFSDFTEAIPAFLTIIMMPLTFSIAEGLAFGFVSYTLVKLFAGRHRENNAVTYVVSVLFILHFVLGKT